MFEIGCMGVQKKINMDFEVLSIQGVSCICAIILIHKNIGDSKYNKPLYL